MLHGCQPLFEYFRILPFFFSFGYLSLEVPSEPVEGHPGESFVDFRHNIIYWNNEYLRFSILKRKGGTLRKGEGLWCGSSRSNRNFESSAFQGDFCGCWNGDGVFYDGFNVALVSSCFYGDCYRFSHL